MGTHLAGKVGLIALCVLALGFGLGAGCPGLSPLPGPQDNGNGNGQGNGGGDGPGATDGAALVADHAALAAFDAIPDAARVAAHAFRIFYGHTSHGSQVVTGMEMIAAENERFAFNGNAGTLQLDEETGVDLGHLGDLAWVDITRERLDTPGHGIDIVVWSWCGGVSDNTAAGIDAYLAAMDELERDYPEVIFVYMTGHLDGTGPDENLWVRNDQIRAYCAQHDKVLFDFADIESYDPDGQLHADGSDACEWCTTWCATNTCPDCIECAHSHCFNCYQKGRAFWWLLARLTGWNGN